jgi:hypothetical protein
VLVDDSGPNSNGDGDEPALRELAARLLAPHYPSDLPAAESEKPELFVGRLPGGMPVEAPIPDGASHRPPRGGRFFQIVLDSALPAERFLDAYRQQLLAAGWRENADLPGRNGFVPRGLRRLFHYAASPSSRLRLLGRVPGLLGQFFLGERGPRLVVTAHDRKTLRRTFASSSGSASRGSITTSPGP